MGNSDTPFPPLRTLLSNAWMITSLFSFEREKKHSLSHLCFRDLRISGYVQRSNKCKVWVLAVVWYMCALAYFGIPTWVESYMYFSVCRQGVWVSWWWTKLDTEKLNTDSHLCSCSRIIQGYCHGKFSHCDPVWKEFSHMAWLWGHLPFTGSHWKVQSWMLTGKDPDASKRKILSIVFSRFSSSIDFLSGEFDFSSLRPWTPYWVLSINKE